MQRVSCIYTQYIFTLCLRILYLMWIYMLNALLFLLCPKASISSSQTRIFHFLSTMISFMALAGRELIFAIEAHLMLHFGFLIKTVVEREGCFSCCRAVLTEPGTFSSSCCAASKGLGVHKQLGGDTARTADLVLCSATAKGTEKGRRDVQSNGICFPK